MLKLTYTFICDKCGVYDKHDFNKMPGANWLPLGWTKVGEQIYCSKYCSKHVVKNKNDNYEKNTNN